MRKFLVGFLLSSLLSVAPASYAAKVTPGTSCKKVGIQENYNGKVYTCIKLGKKLYWDNGKKNSSQSTKTSNKLVCNQTSSGQLSADKTKRCVMTDDLADDGQGGYKKLFGIVSEGSTPAWTLCRHDNQFWSNQTWYDGKWKCGSFVDGQWSKWGWHKSASQYPNAIKTDYVVGSAKNKKPIAQPTKSCSTKSGIVRATLGTDASRGENISAFIFENASDCKLAISATVTVVCPSGGVLMLSNSIRTTGSFSLQGKESLAISGLNFSQYFPQALQQCFLLTGYKSNLVMLSDLVRPAPSVIILSATP